ncbi:uncharacterized protein TNCT_459151 [Trichonephila clavata]|uniref:Uncharacterized protein n=1 Tax=Trichonephila clavata TaxID=2740835 RepID=A0A8X6HU69_TRICU|nr:uncharacterized protein TNCT_459151 [Trichonephila clavata]
MPNIILQKTRLERQLPMYHDFITFCGPEKGLFFSNKPSRDFFLTAETVKSTSLSLKSIDDVHGSYGFPLGVLGVSDGITDNILQEHFQDTASFLVNQTGNTFHSTTSCQTPNSRLRDTLDVITEHLTMPLGTTFS